MIKFFYISFINKLLDEKERWILWTPVALGIGIGLYFSLDAEPDLWLFSLLPLITFAISIYSYRKKYTAFFYIFLISFLVSCGFLTATVKSAFLETVLIHKPIGPIWIEGRILTIEHTLTHVRLSLDQLIALQKAHQYPHWPQKIRIFVKPPKKLKPIPGDKIRIKVKLLPISGPILPQGYDFRLKAFFEGIEATGYGLGHLEILNSSPTSDFFLKLNGVRNSITITLKDALPNAAGGIAAALITGDKAGIPKEITQAYANAGIAHILAISGLHLSLIAGLIFVLIRRGLSLCPTIALRINTKKWAAFLTFWVMLGYLGISGMGIPALRSFCMTSLILLAIMMDRVALTMRTVAIAAFFILLLYPESLLSASFVLSFSAVISLIAACEQGGGFLGFDFKGGSSFFSKALYYFLGILLSTLIATLATTPFTIYFFHKFTLQGFLANLIGIPLTGFWILPLGFLSVLLMPVGFSEIPLKFMGMGIDLLTFCAQIISTWPGSCIRIGQLPPVFAILITLGGLWICFWKTTWRFYGLIPFLLAFVLIPFYSHPTILISSDAKNIGIVTRSGLYTSLNPNHFTSLRWAESLGSPKVIPWKTSKTSSKDVLTYKIKKGPLIIFLKKKKIRRKFCNADLLVSEKSLRHYKKMCSSQRPLIIDRYDTLKKGSFSLYYKEKSKKPYQIQTTKKISVKRPWS